MKLYTLIFSLLLSACGSAEKDSSPTDISDYSAENIQQILESGDHTDDERAALEAQLNQLREDCADGDEDACLELRELWAELEGEGERERDESESSESQEDCEEGETIERLDETYVCEDGEWVLQEQ